MIGPFLITVNQLSLAFAFVITYFFKKTLFKVEGKIKDEVSSSLVTGLIIFLLCYKGLPLITRFADVIKNPFIIVYSSSGLKGLFFALVIMVIYLFIYKSLSLAFLYDSLDAYRFRLFIYIFSFILDDQNTIFSFLLGTIMKGRSVLVEKNLIIPLLPFPIYPARNCSRRSITRFEDRHRSTRL